MAPIPHKIKTNDNSLDKLKTELRKLGKTDEEIFALIRKNKRSTDEKVSEIEREIPASQVQSDWNVTDTNSLAYIKNKPTIPTVPTNVSAFNNDVGYITSSGSCSYATTAGTATYANSAGSASSAGYATEAGSATSASYASDLKAGSSAEIWVGNVKRAYFDSNGSLVLLNSNDSDGTSWNHPALCIGGEASASHVEIDSNEIMAKSNDSTTSTLYLNAEGGNVVINETSGNCGIGVTNPSYKLHVNGTGYSTGGWSCLSDIRKKNVETYDWAPTLEQIAEAPIIRYTFKDDKTEQKHIGSVAQYWQKVTPEAVPVEKDGTLGIMPGTIALTSTISLAREVKSLKEEVAELKALLKKIIQ